jgi:hypothetical protein
MPSRVYVVELERRAGRRRDPRIPWVYVGSSARSPEERFEQHLSGYKSSGLVKRFALRLRPDLYEDLEPLKGSRAACRAEHERARELAGCGFIAHSDGVSYGKDGGFWEEWGAERLEPVVARVDEAAADLDASAFQPLSPERCAALLHGDHGFWVSEYIDPLDPPPAYGLFAHVRIDVLEAQISAGRSLPR